jgi:hypothetical protein
MHFVSLASCTGNLVVVVSFHVLCTSPVFHGFHICVLYITAEIVNGYCIRTVYVYRIDDPSDLAISGIGL